MALNGISTLPTKEARQLAKLELAAAKRDSNGNLRAFYDLTQLPAKYVGNVVVDNPDLSGLLTGRPWIINPDILATNLELEDSANLLLEDGKFILLE